MKSKRHWTPLIQNIHSTINKSSLHVSDFPKGETYVNGSSMIEFINARPA